MNVTMLLAVFAATLVEATEAGTIVLAAATRGWERAMLGAAAAVTLLVGVVGIAGGALARIPLTPLRIVVGAAMIYYGVGWLKKAILRASGRKALHDETAIYAQRKAEDRDALRMAFGGTLLEGVEVVVIVLTFGASSRDLGGAAMAAVAAVLVVVALVAAMRAPLARVPENTLKMAVAVLLLSFGVFWLGEGLGLGWSDVVIPGIVAAVALATFGLVRRLRAVTP